MKSIGGRPCLDFVNTVGGWTPTGTIINDKLGGYQDLVRWAQLGGLLPKAEAAALLALAGKRPARAQVVTARAITLRQALYHIFRSVIHQRKPKEAHLDVLRGELSTARNRQRFTPLAGQFSWTWTDSRDALDSMLWRVSDSASELLTSPELARLRQCGSPNCGWMFLDTSRNHSRQWCDMKDCGNRAKVRRFRERRKLPEPDRR